MLTPEVWSAFAVLLAAHVAGDFLLQTRGDVARRHRPLVLLKHVSIHAALAYVLVGAWLIWYIPVVVFVTHAVIDAVKNRHRDTARVFVVDQCAHLVVLLGLAVWLGYVEDGAGRGWLAIAGPTYVSIVAYLAGFVAAVEGGAYLIAKLVRPYLDELERALAAGRHAPLAPPRGLTNAGKVIGRLERMLIYLLVLVGQPAGIGFLIAAKSIFRFGELKETSNRMESEYIIIGTLASFAYAIAVSYGIAALARLTG